MTHVIEARLKQEWRISTNSAFQLLRAPSFEATTGYQQKASTTHREQK